MDAIFEEEEMSASCFGKTKSIKPSLPEDKVAIIEGTKHILVPSCYNYYCFYLYRVCGPQIWKRKFY